MERIGKIEVGSYLAKEIRFLETEEGKMLSRFRKDLFYTDKGFDSYKDSTEKEKYSYLLVLVSDSISIFEQEGKTWELFVGEIYKFDPRIEHSLIINDKGHRWAGLIFDEVPMKYEIISEHFQTRLSQLSEFFLSLTTIRKRYFSLYYGQNVGVYLDDPAGLEPYLIDGALIDSCDKDRSIALNLSTYSKSSSFEIASNYFFLVNMGIAVNFQNVTVEDQVQLGWVNLK